MIGLILVGIVGPTSADEPQTMEPGVQVSSIEGIPGETIWGSQFLYNPFVVVIKVNSYKTDHTGVVSLIYLDGTCSGLADQEFELFGSVDGGQTYIAITNTTDISSPVRCQFSPDSSVFGQTVLARSAINVWYFAFHFGSDVSSSTYKFRAQFAEGV